MMCESFLAAAPRAKVSELARSGRRFLASVDRAGSGGRPRKSGRCSMDRTGRTRPASYERCSRGEASVALDGLRSGMPVTVTPRCVRSERQPGGIGDQTNGRVEAVPCVDPECPASVLAEHRPAIQSRCVRDFEALCTFCAPFAHFLASTRLSICILPSRCARRGVRTLTILSDQGGLSPLCLPIPPPGRDPQTSPPPRSTAEPPGADPVGLGVRVDAP